MLFKPTFIAIAVAALSTAVHAKTEVNAYITENCVGSGPRLVTKLATIGQCFQIWAPTPVSGITSMQFFTNSEVQCFKWFWDFDCEEFAVETKQRSQDCVNPQRAFSAASVMRVAC